MSLWDKIADAVVTRDPSPRAVQVVKETEPSPSASRFPPGHPFPPADAPAPADSATLGAVYDMLKAKTDFDLTVAGKLLQKYLQPLAGVSMSENQKFMAALALAKNDDPAIQSKLLAVFDSIAAALRSQCDQFEQSARGFDAEIASREAELKELQNRESQLVATIAGMRGQSGATKDSFQRAVARRTSEIAQLKEHYSSMLGGGS